MVYGTVREFAFDFLRDHMSCDGRAPVQPTRDTLLVDEADQTMVDEAGRPLVIAGDPLVTPPHHRARQPCGRRTRPGAGRPVGVGAVPTGGSPGRRPNRPDTHGPARWCPLPNIRDTRRLSAERPALRRQANGLLDEAGPGQPAPAVTHGLMCSLEPDLRAFSLLGPGSNCWNTTWVISTDTQPRPGAGPAGQPGPPTPEGHLLLQRDVDYLVDDDRIVLIDRDTGRPRPDSLYQNGLHPAVEAKEGVAIHPDHRSLAETSVPGFIKRYQRIAGLSGTALEAATEFSALYGLEVAVVEPNEPSRRSDLPTRVYATPSDQLAAVLDETLAAHRLGRPAMVACRTVAQSQLLSRRLAEARIDHRMLHAGTDDAEERAIIADAGRAGAVTVVTNLAGRGTDVRLDEHIDATVLHNFEGIANRALAERQAATVVSDSSATLDTPSPGCWVRTSIWSGTAALPPPCGPAPGEPATRRFLMQKSRRCGSASG